MCGEIVVLSRLISVNRLLRRSTGGMASARRRSLGRARLFQGSGRGGVFLAVRAGDGEDDQTGRRPSSYTGLTLRRSRHVEGVVIDGQVTVRLIDVGVGLQLPDRPAEAGVDEAAPPRARGCRSARKRRCGASWLRTGGRRGFRTGTWPGCRRRRRRDGRAWALGPAPGRPVRAPIRRSSAFLRAPPRWHRDCAGSS